MVSTRRGSHLAPAEHVRPDFEVEIQAPDDTQRTRSGRERNAAQPDGDHRIAKKRRTGSPKPEDDVVTSLPQLPEESQEEIAGGNDVDEDITEVVGASKGADEGEQGNAQHVIVDDTSQGLEEQDVGAIAKQTDARNQSFARTVSRMRLDSLPILDNLSTQMVSTMAKSSYPEMVSLVSNPESEAGQGYMTTRSLFDHAKRVYSTKGPFLFAHELGLVEPTHQDILRKANIATFASSLFGGQNVSLEDMNTSFLEVFVPEGGRLLKAQASLFLDLKTQALIGSLHKDVGSRIELLYRFFPDDLDAQILARRPGAKGMAPSELDFVKRAKSRREILLNDIGSVEGIASLPNKYHWQDFLRDVLLYINKNYDIITNQVNKKITKETSQVIPTIETHNLSQFELENNFPVLPVQHSVPDMPAELPKHDDFVAKAARAAQIALQGHGMSISPPAFGHAQVQVQRQSPQSQYQQMPSFQQYQPPGSSGGQRSSRSPGHGFSSDIPHASQTAPTQVLYERARLAASSKITPVVSRKLGTPSQRRPWTTEEENALMAGLDRVRGPHWSQILAMFGPGGTVSEALKDRNQVQLKDKARNLKLFFLKSGIEVPYYLKYVTGDLKTRAPGQVSKNEARDRQRQEGEEVKAHYDGIQGMMALASSAHNSVYSEEGQSNTSSGGLPESAQAAFDRVMAQIPNQSMDDGSLDPELLSSVQAIANSAAGSMEEELIPASATGTSSNVE